MSLHCAKGSIAAERSNNLKHACNRGNGEGASFIANQGLGLRAERTKVVGR
jgi:hypothetical protein